LVACERRLDRGHLRIQAGAVDQALANKVGQVELLLRDVNLEPQVLGVDSSHVQVRKIAHQADSKGGLEAGLVRVVVRIPQRCQTKRPARGVIIFRSQAFPAGVPQYVDEFHRLRCRLAIAEPRWLIAGRPVKADELRTVIGEVGPTKIFEAAGSHDRTQSGRCVLSLLERTGLSASGRPRTLADLREAWPAEQDTCDKKQNGVLKPSSGRHESC